MIHFVFFTTISNSKTHEKSRKKISVEFYIYTLTYIINSSVFINNMYKAEEEVKVLYATQFQNVTGFSHITFSFLPNLASQRNQHKSNLQMIFSVQVQIITTRGRGSSDDSSHYVEVTY